MSEALKAAQQRLAAREQLGVERYGQTVDRRDVTLGQWLEHLRQEIEDALLYAPAADREWQSLRDQLDAAEAALREICQPHATRPAPPYQIAQAALVRLARLRGESADPDQVEMPFVEPSPRPVGYDPEMGF